MTKYCKYLFLFILIVFESCGVGIDNTNCGIEEIIEYSWTCTWLLDDGPWTFSEYGESAEEIQELFECIYPPTKDYFKPARRGDVNSCESIEGYELFCDCPHRCSGYKDNVYVSCGSPRPYFINKSEIGANVKPEEGSDAPYVSAGHYYDTFIRFGRIDGFAYLYYNVGYVYKVCDFQRVIFRSVPSYYQIGYEIALHPDAADHGADSDVRILSTACQACSPDFVSKWGGILDDCGGPKHEDWLQRRWDNYEDYGWDALFRSVNLNP